MPAVRRSSSAAVAALLARVHTYVASFTNDARATVDVPPRVEPPAIASGMRLCGYFERVAALADVGSGTSLRRTGDSRIDAVGMHLAAVHSMPLHRVVELVAQAMARRARNGSASTRGKRARVSRRTLTSARAVDAQRAAHTPRSGESVRFTLGQ